MSATPSLRQRFASLPPGSCVDLAVAGYAAWTVACNATVIASGTARTLAYAALLALLATAGVTAMLVRNARLRAAYLSDLQDLQSAAAPSVVPADARASRAIAIAASVLALGIWLGAASAWGSFGALCASVLAALYYALRLAPSTPDAPLEPLIDSVVQRRVLLALAIASALFTLLSVRPRSDDTLYLNLAVSMNDYPEQPLLSENTLHGPPGYGIGPQKVFPPYRVHSFELLGGLIAYLTGLESVAVIHLGLATAFAFFTPFAAARLLRLLTPRHWLLALCVLVSYYLLEGSASRGYANHALVRMFNGKSALLTVGVPLIAAYGLRFGARPSGFRFALLFLAQVMGVGLSSTGIWLAPVVAVASAAAGAPTIRFAVTRGLLAVPSAAYVLALGVWIAAQLKTGISEPVVLDTVTEAATAGPVAALPKQFALLQAELPIILGPTRTALATLGVALLAAPLAATLLGARFFAITAALVVLVFANPLLSTWVATYATGLSAYHRALWLLPAPIALAALVARARDAADERLPPGRALAAALAAAGLFYAVAIERPVLSEENGARLAFPPALKLPPRARMVALAVCKVAPEGTRVLAPISVMQQMPIIPHCGHPLFTHERWLSASAAERENRAALAQVVGGTEDIPVERAAWLIEQLDHYRIEVVVLSKEISATPVTKALVRLAGLERVGMVDWQQVFTRPSPESRGSSLTVARRVCEKVPAGTKVLAPFHVATELEPRGCVEVLTTAGRFRAATPAAAEELLALERLGYLAGDLKRDRDAWLEETFARLDVGAVVVTESAMANRHYRAVLANLGFKKLSKIEKHTIYGRTAGETP